MTRSLLDAADLPALRDLARHGSAMAIAGALIDTGLVQFDPDDPAWVDRDRLVLGGPTIITAFQRRLEASGASLAAAAHVAGADATAVALGAAAAGLLDGGIWRAWCAIDESICDDGRTWEAARAAVSADVAGLIVVVAGADSAALWRACGWRVQVVAGADPPWLLSALDQAVVSPPSVVLVDE